MLNEINLLGTQASRQQILPRGLDDRPLAAHVCSQFDHLRLGHRTSANGSRQAIDLFLDDARFLIRLEQLRLRVLQILAEQSKREQGIARPLRIARKSVDRGHDANRGRGHATIR